MFVKGGGKMITKYSFVLSVMVVSFVLTASFIVLNVSVAPTLVLAQGDEEEELQPAPDGGGRGAGPNLAAPKPSVRARGIGAVSGQPEELPKPKPSVRAKGIGAVSGQPVRSLGRSETDSSGYFSFELPKPKPSVKGVSPIPLPKGALGPAADLPKRQDDITTKKK